MKNQTDELEFPFAAVLLAEILEVRVQMSAQGIILAALLGQEHERTPEAALAAQKAILQTARQIVCRQTEEKARALFPAHWPMLHALLQSSEFGKEF